MWPDNRLINLFDIDLPIIQAPMAGSAFSDLAVAVSEAGGLGSLACALLSARLTCSVPRLGSAHSIVKH